MFSPKLSLDRLNDVLTRTLPRRKSFLESAVARFPSLLLFIYGCQEYVHLIAKRVSRTWGGFDGAMLANCVPTL